MRYELVAHSDELWHSAQVVQLLNNPRKRPSSFQRETAMLVDLEDGKCPQCSGQLEIEEIDDCSMFVVCVDCGHDMQVEPDAFGDGCIKYYIPMQCLAEGLDPDDLYS